MIRNWVFVVPIAFAHVVAAFAAPTSTPAEIASGARDAGGYKGVESGDLNRTVDACTDFYEFAKFRVVGPLSNSAEFQQAFSCKAGAEMVRQTEQRCAVW